MKMKNTRIYVLACLALLSTGLAFAAVVDFTSASAGFRASLDRDDSEPDRTGHLGGYAEVVEQVSPAVVSIATRQGLRMQGGTNLPGGAQNDPLRRFFGFGENQVIPEQRMPARPRPGGQGSGVVLTREGHVVTNHHVVANAEEILVSVPGHKDPYPAQIVGTDPATDLTLLRIDASRELQPVVIGSSENLKPGDFVLALGNPFGLDQTVTSGIVSALGRKNLAITDYSDFIQTDASINPGNSGGALVDNKGRLVGINTAIFSRSGGNMGIGFAIPMHMAIDVLDRLATDGEVRRGYLGVMLGELTTGLAAGFGIGDRDGVLVQDVLQGGPADRAGLTVGDLILGYERESVTDMADLRLRIAATRPGTKTEFKVLRDGAELVVPVEIGELPGKPVARIEDRNRSGWSGEETTKGFLAGVTAREIDNRTRMQYQLPNQIEGVLILEVAFDSSSWDSGLRPGDVVAMIDGLPIADAGDVENAMRAFRKAEKEVVVLRVINERGARFIAVDAE